MIIKQCVVQTNGYDLQARMCAIICTHHYMHSNNENNNPVFPGYIWSLTELDAKHRNYASHPPISRIYSRIMPQTQNMSSLI